jgi:hypothetical protein
VRKGVCGTRYQGENGEPPSAADSSRGWTGFRRHRSLSLERGLRSVRPPTNDLRAAGGRAEAAGAFAQPAPRDNAHLWASYAMITAGR